MKITSTLPLDLLTTQRSHILFVLSQPMEGRELDFQDWYVGPYRQAVLKTAGVLTARLYRQHSVDVTGGKYPRLPFRYLGIVELSLDGAYRALPHIEQIAALHRDHGLAEEPATWLYYAASEKVGRSSDGGALLTVAFANPVPGREAEFREWYATRHIRHALNVPALVSGQCFERTQYQRPGSMAAKFSTIALYEQEGTPESMIESFATLPVGTFDFPALDLEDQRFGEWIYQSVSTATME
jgi:hypothetical protein